MAVLLALPGAAKTDYKKWLREEVVWIISQKERDRFSALKSDEQRDAFIQEFWERRDPTPSTPRNEYKEEHYRRYAHALKNFQEGTPGWRTDRGRVYIIHGAPDRENFVASQARLDLGGLSDIRSRMPNTIIWSYHSNPNGKYYRGELNLLFQPSTGLTRQNFALGESSAAQERAEELNRLFGPTTDQNWLEGDVRYRLVVAGPPSIVNTRGADLPTTGIGESAKYIEDLFRSPGDVLEENLERQAGVEKARRQMREAVTARLGFGSLPILLSSRSFARPEGDYRVHIQVDIPCSDLAASLPESSQGKDTSQVDIYCALVDSDGHVTDESIESMEMSRSLIASLPGDNLHYLNAFIVPAGTYTLKAAIRSSEDRRLGFCEQSVLTAPSVRDALALSELLVTNRMQATGVREAAGSEATMTLGDGRFVPHPSRRFLSSDSLFVYFQIYLPEGRELNGTALSIGIQFIRDAAVASRLETREITDPQSTLPGVVNFGTAVPLADFAPGEYTIQVQAIDHTSKRFAFQRSSFFVEESPTSTYAGR